MAEIVSLISIMAKDISGYTLLAFETYLCALVLGPAYTYWKSSKRTTGAKILRILIRDSLIWYFSLASCILVNALAWTASEPKLIALSVATHTFISTIGGARLLLNVRAVYFDSMRGPSSTAVWVPGDPNFFDTQGTIGRPPHGKKAAGDDDCAASISMGIWSNQDVQQNRPPSPEPVIMLKPAPPGRRRVVRPPPSPSLVSMNGGGEGIASSSRLSSSRASPGPEGGREDTSPVQQEEQQPQRTEPLSTPDTPKPRASTSTRLGSTRRRTEDPDVELGELIQNG
ncbi:hypothetical protein FRC01_006896 [Tulasnella sp. 417]|nr:hypothetical protein FRC01_006896 [Tulasnella sp. 417]